MRVRKAAKESPRVRERRRISKKGSERQSKSGRETVSKIEKKNELERLRQRKRKSKAKIGWKKE